MASTLSASAIKLDPVFRVVMDSKDTIHCLKQGRYEIGRSMQCGVRINHREVSRLQATLIRGTDGRFCLFDGDGLGTESSNGTYVNGNRIQRRVLQSGDVIHFGSSAVAAHYYHDQPVSMVTSEEVPTDLVRSDDEPTASIFMENGE